MGRSVTTKSGRILSEADLERLADRMGHDLDLSTWKPRPGRPRLGAPTGRGHSPRLVVRVSDELRERATARAAREGRTISDVIRDLLEGYVQIDR